MEAKLRVFTEGYMTFPLSAEGEHIRLKVGMTEAEWEQRLRIFGAYRELIVRDEVEDETEAEDHMMPACPPSAGRPAGHHGFVDEPAGPPLPPLPPLPPRQPRFSIKEG